MSTLARLIAALDRDPHCRGREWECLCRWFLQNDPVHRSQLRRVWLWKDWPDRWGADAGIDLVAEYRDGSLLAVQAKAYDSTYFVTKADVDTFLSESARPRFAGRLIIGTTNHIGPTALRTLHAQQVPAKFLGLTDLERSAVDWPASPDDLRPRRLTPKKPRPHQEQAIAAVERGFKTSDRGKLVMACGTGKTLMGLWIAERLQAKCALLLFPSLTLLAQTLREWTANSSRPFESLAVCSDPSVSDPDEFVEHASDLDIKVTTDAKMIRAFLRRDGPRVVFGTYQSSPELAEAMKGEGVPAFDLAIADEAHRCAGAVAGEFATILDAKAIPAKRRLFMTATPRYFTGRVKREAAESDYELASMDDEAHFGPLFHELSFGEAIRRGLLADYQVAIVGINDKTYRDYAQKGTFVTIDGKKITDARTLAAQLGLAQAVRKYDLRRTISFHSRIASARSFSASVPEVMAWMPARTRPSGTPWSRYISGEMSSGDRDTLLGRFRKLEEGERGLLANAQCLSEGVDVPAIDGVAFVDPRRSQIGIVQAVGRVIRNSPGKKVGTVVLPVFIETSGKPTTTLDSTAFKPIWDVLRALRAHDAELGEQLDALRRGLGRRSSGALKLPSKIRLDLPIGVDARFAEALRLEIVRATTASWEEWYALLLEYVKREGTSRVPAGHKEDGVALGAWINNQRFAYGQGTLDDARIKRLEAFKGWSWDPLADDWDRNYLLLTQYVKREETSRVPRDHQQDGVALGWWLSTQRKAHSKGSLSPERARRLEAFKDWTWDLFADDWDRTYLVLTQYVKREEASRVPRDYKEDGVALGAWVGKQRVAYGKGALSDERTRRLEAFKDWTWGQFADRWDRNCLLLAKYVKREGTSRAPEDHKEDGVALGVWVRKQREAHRHGSMSPERIKRLEAFKGWSWDPLADDWDRNYLLLTQYVKREETSRVPSGHKEDGVALGVWVGKQREARRRGSISPEHARRLEAFNDWVWSGREAAK